MSQADLLADMILDDILVDTVDEMQRSVIFIVVTSMSFLSGKYFSLEVDLYFKAVCVHSALLFRLESDDETEEMAENLQNRSTLENLFQRLQSFEVIHLMFSPRKFFTLFLSKYPDYRQVKLLLAHQVRFVRRTNHHTP